MSLALLVLAEIMLVPSALVSGLLYPIPTAVATALWTVGRISYTFGYISGEPKKVRMPSVIISKFASDTSL